jgi:hypothetical protein
MKFAQKLLVDEIDHRGRFHQLAAFICTDPESAKMQSSF